MFRKPDPHLLDTSSRDLIKKLLIILGFLLIILLIYNVGDILMILFFALFLNVLFSPFLNFLNRYRIGDLVGTLIIYFIILLFILTVLFAVIPIFAEQIFLMTEKIQRWGTETLSTYESQGIDGFNLPSYVKFALSNFDIKDALNSIKGNAKDIGVFIANNLKGAISNGAGVIGSFASSLFNFIMVFIFSFFIAIERAPIKKFFYDILPDHMSAYLSSKEHTIKVHLGNWLLGQLLLGLSIFGLTLVGILVLRLFGIEIKEYFALALIAGMMEFIPYIGPFIALLPALAIAAGISLKAVVAVLILYIIIQQTENNLLVPYIMSRTLEVSPFAVLLTMTVCGALFGIVGIILAVPLVSVLQIFIGDYLKMRGKMKAAK